MHEERYKRHYKLVCIPARQSKQRPHVRNTDPAVLPLAAHICPQHSIVCAAKCVAASDLETHTRTVISRQSTFRPLLSRNDCTAVTAMNLLCRPMPGSLLAVQLESLALALPFASGKSRCIMQQLRYNQNLFKFQSPCHSGVTRKAVDPRHP